MSVELKMICFGYDEVITCVVVNLSFNLVASGSIDGIFILYDSWDGYIVCVLESILFGCILLFIELFLKLFFVVCACGVVGALFVYDVNGVIFVKLFSWYEVFDVFCVICDE